MSLEKKRSLLLMVVVVMTRVYNSKEKVVVKVVVVVVERHRMNMVRKARYRGMKGTGQDRFKDGERRRAHEIE